MTPRMGRSRELGFPQLLVEEKELLLQEKNLKRLDS